MATKKAKAKKAPAPKKAAAPKKAKQLKLPAEGMSRKSNPEIDDAAELYREARDARMEHTKTEKATKQSLLDVCKKHGVSVYIYESEDGEEYEIEYKEKTDENVKVKRVKAESDARDEH